MKVCLLCEVVNPNCFACIRGGSISSNGEIDTQSRPIPQPIKTLPATIRPATAYAAVKETANSAGVSRANPAISSLSVVSCQDDYIACERCGASVKEKNLRRHQRKTCKPALVADKPIGSPPVAATPKMTSCNAIPPSNQQHDNSKQPKGTLHKSGLLEPCPYCKLDIRTAKLAGHMEDRCPQRPSIGKVQTVKLSVPRHFTYGPSAFKPTNLHLTKVKSSEVTPRKAVRRVSKTTFRGATKLCVDTKEPYLREAFYQETSDKYDASAGWGHAFRDNGAFGSYPAHDSFDEDSFP